MRKASETTEALGTDIEMRDMLAVMTEMIEERRKNEKRARDGGMRVEKQVRVRPRPYCCACKGRPGVKVDGMCACGHSRCPECIVLDSL